MLPKDSTTSGAMQLQSAGKLTTQMPSTSSTVSGFFVMFGLSATRSMTSPQASPHRTLVWFRTLPFENGRKDRQPVNSMEAYR